MQGQEKALLPEHQPHCPSTPRCPIPVKESVIGEDTGKQSCCPGFIWGWDRSKFRENILLCNLRQVTKHCGIIFPAVRQQIILAPSLLIGFMILYKQSHAFY